MRDDVVAILLKVVGDQPVIRRADRSSKNRQVRRATFRSVRALGVAERLPLVRAAAGRSRTRSRATSSHSDDQRQRQRQAPGATTATSDRDATTAIAGAAHICADDLRRRCGRRRAEPIGRHPLEQVPAA